MGWGEPSKDAYDKGRGPRKVRLKGGPLDGQSFEVKRLEDEINVGGNKYRKVSGSMYGNETVTYEYKGR